MTSFNYRLNVHERKINQYYYYYYYYYYFNFLHKRATLGGLGKPFRGFYTFWTENIPTQMPTVSRQISLHGP